MYVRNREEEAEGRGEEPICVEGRGARKDFKNALVLRIPAQIVRDEMALRLLELTFIPFSKRKERERERERCGFKKKRCG